MENDKDNRRKVTIFIYHLFYEENVALIYIIYKQK